MRSFNYVAAELVVLLLCCSTTTFAHENSTFQPRNNTVTGRNINTKALHGTSNSTVCNLQIDESKIEEVLHLMYKPITNTVEIIVSVVSGNKTLYLPEMKWPWASEIGRTIISLVKRAKDTIFPSPIFTSILEVGIEKVDIQVTEGTVGCLPPGDKGSDLVFEFLLHQLSHSEDTRYYKLCRAHDDGSIPFNCCRITGSRSLTICGDYSSAVLKYAPPAVIVVFLISFFMVLPFVLEHIITYPTIEFYKTSDSHMSLISIVSMILFEGCGPAKSFFRRCVFAGLSSLVLTPDFFGCLWLKILFCIWAVVFVVLHDIQMTNEKCKQKCIEECEKKCIRPQWDKNIISCFTVPFSLPFYYIRSQGARVRHKKGSCNDLLFGFIDLLCGMVICILTILYFSICFPFLVVVCLVKFTLFDLLASFVLVHTCPAKGWLKYFLIPVRLLTLVNIVCFTGMTPMFTLSIVVGLSLNAEYFSPFVAPIFTLIVYFWKNWKFSVEAKCLQLKTSILEVCKERAETASVITGTSSGTNNGKNEHNSSTDVNSKNDNKLTCKPDHLFDYLCSCTRDTSKDPHTWKSLKDLSSCCTRSTGQEGIKMDSKTDGNKDHDQSSTSLNYQEGRKGENTDANSDNKPSASKKSGIGENPTEYRDTEGNNTETGPFLSSLPANKEVNIDKNGKESKLIIKFDQHGEAMISKELYEKVSKVILPLDHLLFNFFRRIVFVCIYAFFMFTVMILGRDSGVSGSIQVINALAAALIPFVFDTLFAAPHISVKIAKNMGTKERLEHILKVTKRENKLNNTIFVELINNEESEKNQGIEQTEPQSANTMI